MKTIYTSLPIYDSIEKQAYQKSNRCKNGFEPVPVICLTNQLPAFQWIEDSATSITRIDLVDKSGALTEITSLFTTLPTLHTFTAVKYFVCDGLLSSDVTCGTFYLKITTDNAKIYYSEWFETGDGTDCVKIYFYNSCDFYNILYQTGFVQNIWLRSAIIEPSFPTDEQKLPNGEGRLIRSFARQTKKYTLKTDILPDFMVDVFNRMRLHDYVQMTNRGGDINEMFNIEVSHEPAHEDGFHFFVTLTFDYDETAVVSGCCNNIL